MWKEANAVRASSDTASGMRMGGEREQPTSLEAKVIVYGFVAAILLAPFIAFAALIVALAK